MVQFYLTLINTELELAWEQDFSEKTVSFLINEHQFEFGKINSNQNLNKNPYTLEPVCIRLTPKNPHGYTVEFNDLKKGDKIEVSAWRTSEAVKFVFDDRPNSNYYTSTCHSTKRREGDFEFIQESYFCKEDFEGLKVYVYDPSGDTSQVKDFRIKYYRSE